MHAISQQQHSPITKSPDRSLDRASLGVATGVTLAVAGSIAGHDLRFFSAIGSGALLTMALRLCRLEPIRSYWPTVITLSRLLLTALLAYTGRDLSPLALLLGLLTAFGADGIDGYLARRMAAESKLGARLDGETDAFFVMTLSLLLWQRGQTGTWVLTAGLLRYGYVFATAAFSVREAPRSYLARYTFGLAASGLLLGMIPENPAPAIGPAMATCLLVISFGRSFAYSLASAPKGMSG